MCATPVVDADMATSTGGRTGREPGHGQVGGHTTSAAPDGRETRHGRDGRVVRAARRQPARQHRRGRRGPPDDLGAVADDPGLRLDLLGPQLSDTAPGSSDAPTTTGPSSSTTNPQGPSVDTVDPTTTTTPGDSTTSSSVPPLAVSAILQAANPFDATHGFTVLARHAGELRSGHDRWARSRSAVTSGSAPTRSRRRRPRSSTRRPSACWSAARSGSAAPPAG